MSTALASIVDELHATAARKLIELINTEKDPSLLARLIATALRFKIAVAKATAAASPSADAGRAGEARPPQAPSPQQRPYDPAAPAATDDDGWEPFVPSGLAPLTEQEVAELKRQIGPVEAERRRLERLHILKEEARFLEEDRRRDRERAKTRGASPSAA